MFSSISSGSCSIDVEFLAITDGSEQFSNMAAMLMSAPDPMQVQKY
jgi:hypothetical protein